MNWKYLQHTECTDMKWVHTNGSNVFTHECAQEQMFGQRERVTCDRCVKWTVLAFAFVHTYRSSQSAAPAIQCIVGFTVECFPTDQDKVKGSSAMLQRKAEILFQLRVLPLYCVFSATQTKLSWIEFYVLFSVHSFYFVHLLDSSNNMYHTKNSSVLNNMYV